MSTTGNATARASAVHVPVLLERVTELLAPACAADGAVLVDATLGLAGHAMAMLDAHPGAPADRPRPRPGRPRRGRPPDRGRRPHRPGHPRAGRLRRAPRGPRAAGHRRGAGRAVRPGRLLAPARPSRPRVQLLRRRPAGHADGPERPRAPPPTSSTPTPRRTSPASCGSTARSASPPGSPRPSTASAPASRSPPPPGLAELVRDSIPAATRRTGGHPAKRTFQALRIEVNDELGVLERALPAAIEALAVGGRRSSSSPSTPSRTASSSRPSPRAPPTGPRRTCRCRCPSSGRSCGCSPAVARPPPRPRSPRTAAPAPPASAPPSASGGRRERPLDGRHAGAPSRPGPRVRVVTPAPSATPCRSRASAPGPRPCARSSAWSRACRRGSAGAPSPRPGPGTVRPAGRGPARGTTLGLLILNTVIAVDSLKATSLRAENAERAQEVQRLEQQVVTAGTPGGDRPGRRGRGPRPGRVPPAISCSTPTAGPSCAAPPRLPRAERGDAGRGRG